MRGHGAAGTIAPTMEVSNPTLTLSIDADSEPIAGSIGLPDGSTMPFSGYMELAAALEKIRAKTLTDERGAAPAC